MWIHWLPFVSREWIDNNIEPWWKFKINHAYLHTILYAINEVFMLNIWFLFNKGYANPPLRSSRIYIKNGECAETKEKPYLTFFLFLVFELFGRQKVLPIQPLKIFFVQNWLNLQGILELICRWFYHINIFFMSDS